MCNYTRSKITIEDTAYKWRRILITAYIQTLSQRRGQINPQERRRWRGGGGGRWKNGERKPPDFGIDLELTGCETDLTYVHYVTCVSSALYVTQCDDPSADLPIRDGGQRGRGSSIWPSNRNRTMRERCSCCRIRGRFAFSLVRQEADIWPFGF